METEVDFKQIGGTADVIYLRRSFLLQIIIPTDAGCRGIMYLVAPSTRSSHSRPRLSIRLTSRTRKMAKAYNGQDVNGTA
ncbi:unnamed protein product [Arabidopsis lyrata]|nr:unnamed protein product [Arabidopsis lyrata]